jgi:hypothetical protein
MKVCEQTSDCRDEEGYLCVRDADLGNFELQPGIDLPIAVTIDVDRPDRAYCAAATDL